MSYIKSVARVVLCLHLASIALSVAQAANSEQMLKDTVSKAISEYKRSKDVSVISHVVPELTALCTSKNAAAGGEFFPVCVNAINALYETADLNFDSGKSPVRNSDVPGGRYRSGIDPKSIKDPKLRAEYEKVLAKDHSYAEHYRQQLAVFAAIDDIARLLRQGFKGAAISEIQNALLRDGMNPSFGEDFLKRLDKQAR